jgi:DNA-directed RNA polymerase
VMTYSYSSKKFGMAQQLMEDLMRPLEFAVLTGEYSSHPFGEDNGRAAAKYLAGIIYETIEALVHKPAQAMKMLQKCARSLAHEGKPVTWQTPLGLPWINRYHEMKLETLNLWLHDARVQLTYADGHKAEIDKERATNGVAPNFVHACDAVHLLMVASASASEDITQVATVHDSFGCLAPQAARFRQIIREQFVRLYEHNDVLMQVLAQSRHDLTVHNSQRLPEAPAMGKLNLMEVLDADYAFA